jgi:uncharacterized protein (TIGR02118 family)
MSAPASARARPTARATRRRRGPAAFEKHYAEKHIPLVERMPNLRRFEKALVLATPDGGRPPYHRVAELYFDSEQDLAASLATPEGRAPSEDVPNYATGGATVLIAVID